MLISEATIQIEQLKHLFVNNILKRDDRFQDDIISEMESIVMNKAIRFEIKLFNIPDETNQIDVLLTALFSLIVSGNLDRLRVSRFKNISELLFDKDIPGGKSTWRILREKNIFLQ